MSTLVPHPLSPASRHRLGPIRFAPVFAPADPPSLPAQSFWRRDGCMRVFDLNSLIMDVERSSASVMISYVMMVGVLDCVRVL
ncbi:hypothetical protein FRC08_002569 [Ceratobasidium sp. 394]|nr:hypothetical protein FRC08_002569 [Ceratobasidium sp. 394]